MTTAPQMSSVKYRNQVAFPQRDLNPYGHLKWIFKETPLIKSDNEFEIFHLVNCDRERINEFQFNGL